MLTCFFLLRRPQHDNMHFLIFGLGSVESCITYEFVDIIFFVGLFHCRRISALARGVGNDRVSVEGFVVRSIVKPQESYIIYVFIFWSGERWRQSVAKCLETHVHDTLLLV